MHNRVKDTGMMKECMARDMDWERERWKKEWKGQKDGGRAMLGWRYSMIELVDMRTEQERKQNN